MRFAQRLALAFLVVGTFAGVAFAGPNAGGVLVVHAPGIAYTTDSSAYIGLSAVGCGQDQPPVSPICPQYDPADGANPCLVSAANPTSTKGDGEYEVWYVMAAFADSACPRMKACAFRIQYQNVAILGNGYDATNVFVIEDSDPDGIGGTWPGSGSQTAWSWSGDVSYPRVTSHLWELYWFGGYGYAGTGDSKFELLQHFNPANRYFVDDSVPPLQDAINGYGTLGFLGLAGTNPTPGVPMACCIGATCEIHTVNECSGLGGTSAGVHRCTDDLCQVPPVEETSWGRVKQTYSR